MCAGCSADLHGWNPSLSLFPLTPGADNFSCGDPLTDVVPPPTSATPALAGDPGIVASARFLAACEPDDVARITATAGLLQVHQMIEQKERRDADEHHHSHLNAGFAIHLGAQIGGRHVDGDSGSHRQSVTHRMFTGRHR